MYLGERGHKILREIGLDPIAFDSRSPAGRVLGQAIATYARYQQKAMDALAKLSVATDGALKKDEPELPGVDLVSEALKHRGAMMAMAALNEVLGTSLVVYRLEKGIADGHDR